MTRLDRAQAHRKTLSGSAELVMLNPVKRAARFTFAISFGLASLLSIASLRAGSVDQKMVGKWTVMVPTAQGTSALWVWEIHADGTYNAHTEGQAPDVVHSGRVTFADGTWTFQATQGLPNGTDRGTYQIVASDTVLIVGKLGPGYWHHAGSSSASSPQKAVTPPEGEPELKEPWQISWEEFARELQGLYERRTGEVEMGKFFNGRPVRWKGRVEKCEYDRANGVTYLTFQMPTEVIKFPDGRLARMDSLFLACKGDASLAKDNEVEFQTMLKPGAYPSPVNPVSSSTSDGKEVIAMIVEVDNEKSRIIK